MFTRATDMFYKSLSSTSSLYGPIIKSLKHPRMYNNPYKAMYFANPPQSKTTLRDITCPYYHA